MDTRLLVFGAAVVWSLWATTPPRALAGVELTTELADASSTATESKPPSPGRVVLDGGRVRMEVTRPDNTGAVLIFRGDRNVIWSVNDKQRTYTEVDRAKVRAILERSDATRRQMQKEFDKVPQERRMETLHMLAQGAPKKKREPPTIKPTGRTDTVGAIPCHEVEILRDGEKRREVCVADWKAAGITKADLTALHELNEFEDDTVGSLGGRSQDDALELFDLLDGLPIRVRTFRGGEPRTELRVVRVARKAVDAKLFEVPEGYKKREFSVRMPGEHARVPQGGGASVGGTLPPQSK